MHSLAPYELQRCILNRRIDGLASLATADSSINTFLQNHVIF